MRTPLVCAVVLLASATTAHAFPTLEPQDMAQIGKLAPLLDEPAEYSFNGAASLSGCSGSLFRFEGQPMSSKALVLTNGHCIGFLDTTEVIVGEATNRNVRFFNDAKVKSQPYPATQIVYATMNFTDMAILRLDATYQQIKDQSGVDALIMDSERAVPGEEMVVVSGFWEYVTKCPFDDFVYSMIEGDWNFTDSLRYGPGCVTFGGTSGSPVISVTSGKIIGVNNTGYEGGEPCTLNNPCEIDEDGRMTTLTGGAYGQQTFHLYHCLTADFGIDLSKPGCDLPKPDDSGRLRITSIELLTDEVCDGDSTLDAGETGILAVGLTNIGKTGLDALEVSGSSKAPGVLFPGSGVAVDSLASMESTMVEIPVALDKGMSGINLADLVVTAQDPAASPAEMKLATIHRVNYDDAAAASREDSVESGVVPWTTATQGASTTTWQRHWDGVSNTVWQGRDISKAADQRLESPTLHVGSERLVVKFVHRYAFEANEDGFFDGGVIEVSPDSGNTWQDVTQLIPNVGYTGALASDSGNPLGGRMAFVGKTEGDAMIPVMLNFGTKLAGKKVKLRFRIGTDEGTGDRGWEIDNLIVSGISNQPFARIVPDKTACDKSDDFKADSAGDMAAAGGCSTSGGASGAAWLVALGLLVLVRRRRR